MQQLAVTRLAEQVQALVAEGRAPLLLDVREPWEIATASLSLPGAQRLDIPMQQIPGRLAEIDPQRRAETLSVEEFVRLANAQPQKPQT